MKVIGEEMLGDLMNGLAHIQEEMLFVLRLLDWLFIPKSVIPTH